MIDAPTSEDIKKIRERIENLWSQVRELEKHQKEERYASHFSGGQPGIEREMKERQSRINALRSEIQRLEELEWGPQEKIQDARDALSRMFLRNLKTFWRGLDYYGFEANNPEPALRLMREWEKITEGVSEDDLEVTEDTFYAPVVKRRKENPSDA